MGMSQKRSVAAAPVEGPFSYENWRAMDRGASPFGASEFPLYSDARVIGSVPEGCGPYRLLNTVPRDLPRGRAVPVLFLRADCYLAPGAFRSDMSRTDDSRYHGGSYADEVAALLSLRLGMRLRAGEEVRVFGFGWADPLGTIASGVAERGPDLPPASGPPRLPWLLRAQRVTSSTLDPFHTLSPADAVALVRAARLYQSAVWIADADPNLAWLMLVSALEAAAVHWRMSAGEPEDVLREVKPAWAEMLSAAGGHDLLRSMATELVPLLGATRRFIDFVKRFTPGAPPDRPSEAFRRDWSPKAIGKVADAVYAYRSRSLHAGTPFPAPMFEAPRDWGDGVPSETPDGLATSTAGGTWTRDAYPILLHGFEYIARNALINWWHSLAPVAEDEGPGSEQATNDGAPPVAGSV